MTEILLSGYGYGNGFRFGGYYGWYGLLYDKTFILVIIGIVISLIASARVKTAFNKYSKVNARCGMTGADVAQRLLNANGIYDVQITRVQGNMTDHYDPKNKVLALSDTVHGRTSVSAVAVAAHEVGHCIQHDKGYSPLTFRTALVPVANIGSSLSWVFIMAGIIFSGWYILIDIGIILFSLAVLFQVVTLPVEFNASKRALAALEDNGILYPDEIKGGKSVLRAAALTYVASTLAAVLQLLRLLLLFGGRRRD